MEPFDLGRQLLDSSPRAEYRPSSDAPVEKGLHFGQRKLLFSEIEFLTAICSAKVDDAIVVYAGAANGSHLPFLFGMFPSIKFVLIDPAPFCSALIEMDRRKSSSQLLELINECCSDELCARIRKTYPVQSLYLISDIRSGNPPDLTNWENTQLMERDNAMQASWCYSLGAKAAMLKFHPPYPPTTLDDKTPDSIQYFKGEALWGVWAPKSSTEVRLVVTGPFVDRSKLTAATYNCKAFEEQCYYYNTNGRYARDCAAERRILSRYVALTNSKESVQAISSKISTALKTEGFQPLADGFNEDDARLYVFLYQSRCPNPDVVYADWRGKVTKNLVLKWCALGRGCEEAIAGFWRRASWKALSEAYSATAQRARDQ